MSRELILVALILLLIGALPILPLKWRVRLALDRQFDLDGGDIIDSSVTKYMNTELAKKECKPCTEGTPALKGEALKQMQSRLGAGWQVLNEERLEKEFKFPDFRQALAFVNKVGDIAEKENHHPDIFFTWGEARLQIWTHKIHGLSENDFILAAKIGELGQNK